MSQPSPGASSTTLSATGNTTPVKWRDAVAVQVTGAATSINAIVERSTQDPSGSAGANWAPADATPISGNPSTGIPVSSYYEPGAAWWRVRVTAMTGAPALVVVNGQLAS